ncbi:hypothetical protein Gotur_003047, partial [Gossypium turneri]
MKMSNGKLLGWCLTRFCIDVETSIGFRMKRFTVGAMITPEYHGWRSKRINDNIPEPSHEGSQLIEEHLRVVPSELEILKQDFERRNTKLEKQIEQIE